MSIKRVEAYRAKTYLRNGRLSSVDQAIEFVRERGFVFFWPITGIEFPSLWVAVAGDRPVANEHDDPGHVTWGWKDRMLGRRKWYYAKLLRKKATLISLDMAPYFYALTENYGDHEEDYLIQYEAGRLKQEAKLVYEALLRHGAMDTVELRRKSGLARRESKYRFDRSLAELQSDMKILPIGVAEAGAWNYAFIYDLVPRHLPNLPEEARSISEDEARDELVKRYFRSVGAAPMSQVGKVLGWRKADLKAAIDAAVERGLLRYDSQEHQTKDQWVALEELL